MNISDFAIYRKKDRIYSMGFEIKNLLKNNGLPAMIGGGNKSSPFSDLGLPVGIALLNNKIKSDYSIKQQSGGVIGEDLYNKLLHLSEQRKKTNSKTKKNRKKKRKKTRKI
jgi:hypothetical protein